MILKVKKLLNISHFWLLVAAVAVGIGHLYPAGDADLGWHLRYGQEIWQTGKVATPNTFSFPMADYVWPNHSWGYDALLYPWFNQFGFFGLTMAAGLIIGGAFYLLNRNSRPELVVPGAMVLIYFGSLLLNLGLRSNLTSLLLTAVWWVVVRNYFKTGNWRSLLPLPGLFLAWANLHGQFFWALLLTGLGLVIYWWQQKQLDRKAVYLLAASVLATLINPFGLGLHQTALAHFRSPSYEFILEWLPWQLVSWPMLVYLTTAGLSLWLAKRSGYSFGKPVFLILGLVFIQSLLARRMIPFFLILLLPELNLILNKWIGKLKLPKRRLLLLADRLGIGVILVIISWQFIGLLPQLSGQNWDNYCLRELLCSEPAVKYLKDNRIQGQLFNAYRLGGHLIYRYPEEKVFIDGRMTVWVDDKGSLPFIDYFKMIHTETGFEQLLAEYSFDYFLLHPQFELADKLKQWGYPVIYRDQVVELFKSPSI